MDTKIYYIFKLKKYTYSVIRNTRVFCFKIIEEIHNYSLIRRLPSHQT